MIVGVPRESFPGRAAGGPGPRRDPEPREGGLEVFVEAGAGAEAGYPDADYIAKGATGPGEPGRGLRHGRHRRPGARAMARTTGPARTTFRCCGADQVLIGFLRPLGSIETIREIAEQRRHVVLRRADAADDPAQSMDALSSMATICGYKAVVIAADKLPRMFPDADHGGGHDHAGARAGDRGGRGRPAGDRHGAAAGRRRLGLRHAAGRARSRSRAWAAGSSSCPSRPRTPRTRAATARAQDETFYQRQRELLGRVVAESDVVITAAVIPGKKSPVLVTAEMVARMAPGSVIVDLAAERGGNCELTRPGGDRRSSTASPSSAGSTSPAPSPTTPARCTPATSRAFLASPRQGRQAARWTWTTRSSARRC